MNGHRKFHKANGAAFKAGEQWTSCDSAGIKCSITGVRKFGEGKWDYEVSYVFPDGRTSEKDAWNFQVRYEHIADKNL